MKLFITGGTGFLGSVCVEKFIKSPEVEKIYILTHKSQINSSSPKIEILQGDIRNLHEISIADNIDSCIVLASAGVHGKTSEKLTYSINYNATESAIKFCKRNNINRIIFTSSINVNLPKLGAYARSKLDSEKIIRESGLNYLIFRPSLIYGRKCKFGLYMIEKFIRKFGFVPVFGDGKKLEQPIHVDECAEYINYYTLNNSSGRIIELGGFDAMTYNDLCEKIASCMNKRVKLLHVPAWPFLSVLKIFESLNISLPISSEQIYHVDSDLSCNMQEIYQETGITQKSFIENFSRDGICES
ncbi:MAG: NAD-dependent epimerase/dehydratase family protein [Synergistaceae bacterium]|nr:NAD-dependent epimerase/dehydratase family protein [Synergistaceae bacterium]